MWRLRPMPLTSTFIPFAARNPTQGTHRAQPFQGVTMTAPEPQSSAAPGEAFSPDFSKGLLPAVAQDHASGEVLMLAYMNEEAWHKTLASGEAHYWSRSREKIWHKGGTSGHIQKVRAVRLDCDSDAILLFVEQVGGAACHTGRRTCFYREWKDGAVNECAPLVFDPQKVYGV